MSVPLSLAAFDSPFLPAASANHSRPLSAAADVMCMPRDSGGRVHCARGSKKYHQHCWLTGSVHPAAHLTGKQLPHVCSGPCRCCQGRRS